MARVHRVRRRLYEILERGLPGDRTSAIVHAAIITLVLLSVASVVIESERELTKGWSIVFDIIEWLVVTALTVEFILRLWCAPDHAPLRHLSPWRARLRLLRHPSAILDMAALAPFYLAFFMPGDLRSLVVLRLLRFFKLARYSPALTSLFDAIYGERRALIGCLIILGGSILIAASIMHALEHDAQPDKFGSILQSSYWAVITLTTVGYGDVFPVTPWGRLFAGVTAIVGIVMLALPVGIIASAFAREIHRRDFVVTWSMVARVPIFSDLDAEEVAEIMRYLKAQTCEAGEIIVKRGEVAHSMYFIAGGAVELDLGAETVEMGAGHFFGEVAVLRKAERSATVRALTRSRLLVLDAADLHHLMEISPEMGRRIREVVKSKIAAERIGPRGDIASEEISSPRSSDV